MTALEILKMIETVSPDDGAKLDEIDARVNCYIGKYVFLRMMPKTNPNAIFYKTNDPEGGLTEIENISVNFYTRSRDALKAIRPKDWQFRMVEDSGSAIWACMLTKWGPRSTPAGFVDYYWQGKFKTEELAELHAIIQAIEFERKAA